MARAMDNLTAGGLIDLVEIRVGDALQTLRVDLPERIDLVLLDGAKRSILRSWSWWRATSGQTPSSSPTTRDHSPDYLARVRAPGQGYMSTPFAEDVERSIRIG